MNELKPHIFVRHPDRKKLTCWSCDSRKEEHQFTIHQPSIEVFVTKHRKKGNARSGRPKNSRIRAVR